MIETTLRDLTQEMLVLGRGVKVAIDQRASLDARWDDHERRISEIERGSSKH